MTFLVAGHETTSAATAWALCYLSKNQEVQNKLRKEIVKEFPDKDFRQIPAIALSAFASRENKERAFSSGFQKYHTKPFEPNQLVDEIAQLIKNK